MKRLPHPVWRAMLAGAVLAVALAAGPALAKPKVQIWTDRGGRPVYHEGDAMRVKVRTSMDANLLIYEIGPDGSIELLFPWKRGSDRIEAGRTLKLPPDGADFQLVVEQMGRGQLVAIASERPFRDLPWFLRPFDAQAASVGYEAVPETDEVAGVDRDGRVVGERWLVMENIRRRVVQDPDVEDAAACATYEVRLPAPPIFIAVAKPAIVWGCWPQPSCETAPAPSVGVQAEPASAGESPGQQEPAQPESPRYKAPPPPGPPPPPPVYKSPPPQPVPPQAKPDRPEPPVGRKR